MPNKTKRVATGTILDPVRMRQMQAEGRKVNEVWTPNPAQTRIMHLKEFEIFVAAGKYSGKSELGIYWMVMGNPHEPDFDEDGREILYNMSYVYHPGFLGAVIRLNERDLAEWVDRARPYYEDVLGGSYTKNPAEFRWPSGARIFLGHANDGNAWLKYQGQNIIRFLIEEAGQIPTMELFDQIRTCVRSKWPELRPQLMMTANPGGPGQCVDEGDVLTTTGWKPIQDVRVGEEIYSLTSKGEMVTRRVTQVHAAQHDGWMVRAKARGLNMSCTPNHKVGKALGVRGERNGDVLSLVEFMNLPGQATIVRTSFSWNGSNPEMFDVPPLPEGFKIGKNRWIRQPQSIPWNDYCSLMGWFLSEGHTTAKENVFGISQVKTQGRHAILQLLRRLEFRFQIAQRSFLITSPEWTQYLAQFGKCHQKYIPTEIKNGSRESLEIMLDSLMDGDGCWETRGRSGVYYTTSKRLADDVAEIALKAGYLVYTTTRFRDGDLEKHRFQGRIIRQTLRCWEVYLKKAKSNGTEILTGLHRYKVETQTKRRSDIKVEDYSGLVYCIGVEDTHNFFIRQGGCVWLSGNSILFDRFIEPKDREGNPILHPVTQTPLTQEDGGYITLTEGAVNPFTGETIEIDRIWAPLYMTDNPYAITNKNYIAVLATMRDEKMKRAYLLGDWKAFRGSYFDIFNKEIHTYDPATRNVAGWWTPSVGLDWGYQHNTAAYKHKIDPETKQHLIYDEFVTNHTDLVELGAALARWLEPELRIHGSVTMHVSHDLYHERTGEITSAEFIAQGMERVIGKGLCYVPDAMVRRLKEQAQRDGTPWNEDDENRITSARPRGVTFRRAPQSRSVGFMYLRSLMRTKPLFAPSEVKSVDWQRALEISANASSDAYAAYIRSFHQEIEILPQMLISRACTRLIKAIPKCIHDPKDPESVDKAHFDGMDEIDGWRYTLVGVRDDSPSTLPIPQARAVKMEQIRAANPKLTTLDLIWIARGMEEEEEDEFEGGFCLTRSSRIVN